ncbi:MAG: hypothetical protein JOZ19_14545 [Rubrobacter sp.]|nr:hypothetical protein [Rubrobacter sp.]
MLPPRPRKFITGSRPEEPSEPDEEVREGLERAYSRLDMIFETPEAYLDFWFPGQNLTLEDLPYDLADYYLYDLERTDGGFTPKASRGAAEEDANSVFFDGPTSAVLNDVGWPVALIRAAEGFFPGSKPLIPEETRNTTAEALDLRLECLLPGANHYTMLFQEFGKQVANTIDNFLQQID